jgi:outer membrane receptor protein involved in Fe transport
MLNLASTKTNVQLLKSGGFMKKIYNLITACTALFFSVNVHAQQSGKITGFIKSPDNKAIDAATVTLMKAKDTSIVKISVTGKTGLFEFENIKNDNYLLLVDAIGYNKLTGKPFAVTTDKQTINAGDIQLTAATQSLNDVSVSAQRPLVETKIDKTIVNVDASPTNAGLSALEVLEKSPGVTVDNDGNISLKGKQGVKIFIDGKPAYLSGQDLTNYLKNLPSNQLDQIEIMTQPSAKYDASGNSGIINLKTKKSVNNGFNGSVSLSGIVAKYFKSPNSINFNWHKGKTNYYGNFGYAYWEGFNDINIDRSLREDKSMPFNRYVEQHTFGRFSGRFYNFKTGVDWFANKKTTIGFVVNGSLDDTKFTSNGTANIFDSIHQFVQYNDAHSQTKDPWTNVGFNLNLQHKLDTSGKEISADADYILYRTKGHQYSYNYLYNADKEPSEDPFLLNGYLPANIDIFSFKSDYKQPLKNKATLEAGIKLSYVKTDNDAQYLIYEANTAKWVNDESRSNHFIYRENINAAYINLQKQIKKFGIQLGLRAEQTIAEGNQVIKNISFKKNYTKLFPTSYFSYQMNDNNTFGLSYGRRIERPSYQDLNPFQYQLDRYTYQQGNPDLQPQFSHNIELSYNYKGQLNVSANFTSISDIINDILITKKEPADSNYTTYQTKENIASNKNLGLSVNYNKKLAKWWSINVFANVFNNHYKGIIDSEKIDASVTAFHGNLNSQFTFNKGWAAEISGFYNSENLVSSAILARPMGMFSLGGSKQILKTKGTIRLNVRDPFYIMRFRGSTDLNKGLTEVHSVWDNRRLIFTFTYRFGKTNSPQPRRRTTGADDEQNRVNTGGQQ